MKRVEIINNFIEKQEDELNQLIADECDCPTLINKLKEDIKKSQQIKQDLEVLEIIKKKKVDMTYFIVAIHSNLPIDEQINYYNRSQCNYCKLLDEEFIKLKQWLEVNE